MCRKTTIIQNKMDKEKKAITLLSDTVTYKRLSKDPTPEFKQELKLMVKYSTSG